MTAWRGIVNFSRIYSSGDGRQRRGRSRSRSRERQSAGCSHQLNLSLGESQAEPSRSDEPLSLCNRNDGGQKLSPVFSIRPWHNSAPSRFMGDVSPGRRTADEEREKRTRWFHEGRREGGTVCWQAASIDPRIPSCFQEYVS